MVVRDSYASGVEGNPQSEGKANKGHPAQRRRKPAPEVQAEQDETRYDKDTKRCHEGLWSRPPPNGSRLSCGALNKE
jgi:hypothetical protein